MDAIYIVKIVELVLLYGPEIASRMIIGLNVDHITLAQIEALLVKPPQWYFDEQGVVDAE